MREEINNMSLEELKDFRKELFNELNVVGTLITEKENEEDYKNYSNYKGKFVKCDDQYFFVRDVTKLEFSVQIEGPSITIDGDSFIYYETDYAIADDSIVEISDLEFNEVLNKAVASIKASFEVRD